MGNRKVTQVANGSISQGSTDAINGGQLWEALQGLGGSSFDETLWNDRWENINNRFGQGTARALDGRVVDVQAPAGGDERMSFMAALEDLPIEAPSAAAKVILKARTGSVVMNEAVALATPGL